MEVEDAVVHANEVSRLVLEHAYVGVLVGAAPTSPPLASSLRWLGSDRVEEGTATVEEARRAAEDLRWSEAYDRLRHLDLDRLGSEDLELLADAAWWCCRVEEEIDVRQRAFAGYVREGRRRPAAYTAWLLSVRHGLRGEPAAASGWLQRAQRQLADEPENVEHGYVACSQAEQALGVGDLDAAEAHARRAIDLGERTGTPELVALAVSWQGLCRLARNDVVQGLRTLDEAMASVTAGELDAHFTGWVACFAVGMCMGVADLGRASGWAQAAWEWASTLPESTPYQGLCRVRQVEVMALCGDLAEAVAESRRACEEVLAFEPHLAGEAFAVRGEILRRHGEIAGAEEAFAKARELGHDPQPGLARIRLAQGRGTAAAAALKASLADPGRAPYHRAGLLAAQVEVAVAEGDLDTARTACDDLTAIADEVPSDALHATAATARGRVRLAEGDAEAALATLRPAASTWRALGLGCDLAEVRMLIGLARRALGDDEGAEVELRAAHRGFEELGAHADAARVADHLDVPAARPKGLTDRECEVLGLVAAGRTNRQIAAELVLSEHTVARHLSNIFTKLEVTSRTAAAAFAFEHELL